MANQKTVVNLAASARKSAKTKAIREISNNSGMKKSAVSKAAEAGSRLNYDNPAYKNLIGAIAEGDKARATSYTKKLQNAGKATTSKKCK